MKRKLTGHYVKTGKKSASAAGGMVFKSQADQISHTLPTTRTAAILMRGTWNKASEMGTTHS